MRSGSLVDLASGTQERLQAIDAGDGVVLWASGIGGTVVRSVDGGASWRLLPVEGAAELELRDIEAFGAERAFALAAGPGEQSRILATADGGATWIERWRNPEPEAFYDCFDFWRDGRGIAFSDSVGNRLLLAVTRDGVTWHAGPFGPPALDGEGGFAASGTCLITGDAGRAWIGTGAAGVARVLATEDYGTSWAVFETPISAGGEAAGILSLARDDAGGLYAFGGDIADAESRGGRVACSGDGGRSWTPTKGEPGFAGAIYAGAARGGGEGAELLAVGPGGAGYSPDAGATWIGIDQRSWWSVAWTPMGDAILAGPEGRLARWRPERG
ncbi:MAG TPA: hypothetical protein VMT85_11120 [Thermoanaerobaculia bacterium]|nr:hypothetical protein [Thermoanaerobaculia bacterium]